MPRIIALAAIWTAAVLGLHSIPRRELEKIPGAQEWVRASGPDQLVHLALFAVLGLLWSACWPRRPLTIVAVGVAYGAALEFYQGWLIPGRNCSPDDAVADAAGLIFGTVAAAGYHLWRRRRLSSPPAT